jgi:hypothetical protein
LPNTEAFHITLFVVEERQVTALLPHTRLAQRAYFRKRWVAAPVLGDSAVCNTFAAPVQQSPELTEGTSRFSQLMQFVVLYKAASF